MPVNAVAASTPYRKRTVGNYRYHIDPRISATQLAVFMVSPDSRRDTIIKDAAKAATVRMVSYAPARVATARCYDGHGINADSLIAEADAMDARIYTDAFEEKCHKMSSPVLRRFAGIVPNIPCEGTKLRRPQQGWAHLLINGVRVSVQPEVVYSIQHRGTTKYGGVISNFAKDPSLAKSHDGYTAGDYAALLVFLMLSVNYGSGDQGPRAANCFSVDVQRDTFYTLPSSHRTMVKHLEAACRTIALHWDVSPTGPIETGEDEEDVF